MLRPYEASSAQEDDPVHMIRHNHELIQGDH